MDKICPRCQRKNRESAGFCSICGENLNSGTVSLAGSLLDNRYEIISVLKTGGMGRVYKARDTRFGEIVALKEMLSTGGDQSYTERRFQEEAKLLYKLQHRGLPKVIDRFSIRNAGEYLHYLVMSFISGRDLEALVQKRRGSPFSEETAVDIFNQILDILIYLHHQQPPVIYRDLKPSNIMVVEEDSKNKVFLVDFGIARLFQPNQKGSMVGTPGYAPPEQYTGYAEPRSDLYSLAVVIHYLLTGKDPTDANRPTFTFERIKNLNPAVPQYLNDIIMGMLEFDVDNRPPSAEKVKEMLEKKEYTDKIPHNPPPQVGGSTDSGLPAIFKDVDSTDEKGKTLLHHASARGDLDHVKALILEGADPDTRAMIKVGSVVLGDRWTPLCEAVSRGNKDVANFLLSQGADINTLDEEGKTPLHLAVQGGYRDLTELLIERGASINIKDNCEKPPLHIACERGDPEIAQILIQAGSSIEETDIDGNSLLHLAVNSYQLIKILLSKGLLINQTNKKGETPLLCAIEKGTLDTVQYLLKKGAKTGIADQKGMTPLHKAVLRGERELVELIMHRSLDINTENKAGKTPYDLALAEDNQELLNILKKDPRFKDKDGLTSLHISSKNGDVNQAEILIKTGAYINARDKDGWTPLHWATHQGHRETVYLLLKSGADADIRDGLLKETPLHVSVRADKILIAEMLLSHGANVNLQNQNQENPLDLARRMKKNQFIQILRQHGAKESRNWWEIFGT